uniref:Uncharacterized protein n=1 Tax=Ditylenchus dipsaci TaxID=166011 RepID=A0A915DZJ0_9BILA
MAFCHSLQPEVSGWEEKDSALELLQSCRNFLDLDAEKLQTQILHFAKFDESEFVRSSATNILIQMLRDDPSQMSVAVKEEVGKLKRMEDEANQPAGAQERDMRTEIEDIIKTMQNNCGLDDCVSKECY